ncbi:MAG: hypothetical protein A2W17_03510 [Planctomycetes bacterium RBG_16_41_13]|nr:MAG: hypothetical protein A2W17_03510 [Planctomycetes bacterium RBG_16_41_13]
MKRKITPEGIIKRQVREYLLLKGWRIYPIVQNAFSHHGMPIETAIRLGEFFTGYCIDVGNEECLIHNLAQLMWAYEIKELNEAQTEKIK